MIRILLKKSKASLIPQNEPVGAVQQGVRVVQIWPSSALCYCEKEDLS